LVPVDFWTVTMAPVNRLIMCRYVAIGGLSYGVDISVLFLTHGIAGVWLPLATSIAYTVTLFVNFSLNRAWVFRAGGGPASGQVSRYAALCVLNYALTVLLVTLQAELGVNYLVAKTGATAVAAILNYAVYRSWVFAPAPGA
jgi:putative flippase GtrA